MRIRRDVATRASSRKAATALATTAPDSVATAGSVPEATVVRLANYLRALTSFDERGVETISSEALAVAAGANSAVLRKDLSYLGSYGIRGVGYDVTTLTHLISRTLGLAVHRRVALIGVGNLGQALAGYGGFASRGFEISALLDVDPARVGSRIGGLIVDGIDSLEQIIAERRIEIAVLAIPAGVAQELCDRLVASGVTSVLNFAPVALTAPAHVEIRQVDLAAELQILSFHEQQKEHRREHDQESSTERQWAPA